MRYQGSIGVPSFYLALALATALTPANASGLGAAASTAAASESAQRDVSAAEPLEEITVTAQKRTQSIQDVPISIRALSEKELERLGANDLQDYAGFAPSLNLVGQGPLRTQITMRGVSTGDLRFDRSEVRETVGLYLDETPISTQIVSPNLGLLDIERIEVLRGPQGTLYGAGSLSGTVRMITRKPNLGETQVSGYTTVSTTEHGGGNYDAGGVLNLPISNNLAALRLVGFYVNDSGFINDLSTGQTHINDTHESGGRLALRVKPMDLLTVDAGVLYQQTHLGGDFSYRAEAGDLNELTRIREPSDSSMTLPSLVAVYDTGPALITSATSYFKKDASFRLDIGRYADIVIAGPNNIDGPIDTVYHEREFTEELRLSSPAEARVSYTVGAFYQHQDNGFSQNATLPGADAAAGIDSTLYGGNRDELYGGTISLKSTQYALFGEVTANLTPRLAVTGGGREFKVTTHSLIDLFGIFSVPLVGTQPFTFGANGFDPKFNVTYKLTDDDRVYVQAAKGFRLGGTNEPVPANFCAADLAALGFNQPPPSFQSDSLWNYEVGAKTAWAGGRLTANAASYYIDWKHPPLTADFVCGFSTIINAGDFRIAGAEFDLEARPIRPLTLRLGGAFNDGKLSGNVAALGGHDGDRIPQTPRVTADASADYDFPVNLGRTNTRGFIHVDYRYVGNRVTQFPDNPNYSGYYVLPSYQLLAFRMGLSWDHLSAEAFLDNALDTRSVLNETKFYRDYDKIRGTAIVTNQPRTVGLKFAFSY